MSSKYYQNYNSGDITPTEYNSNAFTIVFLDKLNNTFSASMLNGDFKTAILSLEHIFSELTFKDAKGFNFEEIEKEIEALKIEILKSDFKYRTPNGNLVYKFPELRFSVHLSIMRLKRKLGRLKHKLGLGLTEKDDPKFAFASDPDLHGRSIEG